MPEYNYAGEDRNQQDNPMGENLAHDNDLLMEQILGNINSTPIGQVLKRISLLPEVRAEKILRVRQQLNKGQYNLNERLNAAVDKVIEELTA